MTIPGSARRKRIRIAALIVVLFVAACAAYIVFQKFLSTPDPFWAGPVSPPTIAIQSRIGDGPWIKESAIYPLKGQTVSLKVDVVPDALIRWYRILPDISKIYSNCNQPWQKNPYKWKGFAKIKYSREELTRFRGRWEVNPFEEQHETACIGFLESSSRVRDHKSRSNFLRKRIGSFWFQVEVTRNGKLERSPGIEDSDKRGLSTKVFRVSVRDGQGYLGYLTSFFNVPGLFGSVPYQSSNYIGVDCADVLIAAYGKWKQHRTTKDYCVASLVKQLPIIAEFDVQSGTPNKKIQWRNPIRPGDLIAVKHVGKSKYQHIGALFSDANRNGLLDNNDLVLHAGPLPLQYVRLRDGNFDGHVALLRLEGSFLPLQETLLRRLGREALHRLYQVFQPNRP